MRIEGLHMRIDAEIIRIIDEAIKLVWVDEIKRDYEENWIMNEDGLKNALYFHLRKQLEPILVENNLRIFTEFKDAEFQGKQYRPDMVIAHVDMESDADYWRQAVTNCVAVIELKFKSNFRDQKECSLGKGKGSGTECILCKGYMRAAVLCCRTLTITFIKF